MTKAGGKAKQPNCAVKRPVDPENCKQQNKSEAGGSKSRITEPRKQSKKRTATEDNSKQKNKRKVETGRLQEKLLGK